MLNPLLSFTVAISTVDISVHEQILLFRDKGTVWTRLKVYREYCDGEHTIPLSDKQRKILVNLVGKNQFCDNVCHQIVDEAANRCEFIRYDTTNVALKNWADEWFALTRIEDRQNSINYCTLRDGNFVIAVDFDAEDDRVEFYQELWWNGESGVWIHYDAKDKPAFGVKQWQVYDNGRITHRRNIWYPDRLEKWQSADIVNWTPYLDVDDTDEFDDEGAPLPVWPLPWLDEKGDPLGIPYIHLRNGGRMRGNYGLSELAGGVIGFQDQLNDLQYALSAASRLTAFPQFWGTGIKLKNKEGSTEKLPIEVDAGKFHVTENENAKFGMFQSGDMSQLISVYNMKLKRVAQMTSTPVHIITGGDWPSAEALMRAELPAVGKARRQISSLKTSWVQLLITAIKINNTFSSDGTVTIDSDIRKAIVTAYFADPEKRDIVSRSIVVHNLGSNISFKEALRIMNYSEEKVQQIYDEKVKEVQDLAGSTMTNFLRGSSPNSKQKEASGGTSTTSNNQQPNPKQ